MQARGPTSRAAPPRLAGGGLEPVAATRGTAPAAPGLPAAPAARPRPQLPGSGTRSRPPCSALPGLHPPPTSDCGPHWKHRFPLPAHPDESTEDFLRCIFRDPSLKEASFAQSWLSLVIYTKTLYLRVHLSSRTSIYWV